MWRLTRKSYSLSSVRSRLFSTNAFKPYISESDEPLEYEDQPNSGLKGVVVTHLPKSYNDQKLAKKLSESLSVSQKNLTIYKNWAGQPAYAFVSYKDMPKLYSHKMLLDDHKIYVKVFHIQTASDFHAENSPLAGGYDSRRVVVFSINPDCNEQDIYDIFSRCGEILKIKMPRDYEIPSTLSIIGEYNYDFPYELIEYPSVKDEISSRGIRDSNFIQEISTYLLSQAHTIKKQLDKAFYEPELRAAYDKMHNYWSLARHFKEYLCTKPTPNEALIDETFNALQNSKFILQTKAKLEDLHIEAYKETEAFINTLFPNKGYCHIQFATKRAAEKAVLSGTIMFQDSYKIRVAFDRNVPGWFYHSRLLEEAEIQELDQPKNNKTTNNKLEAMTELIEMRFEKAYLDLNENFRYYYGSDDKDDPVITGKLNSYDEALEVQSSIFSQNSQELDRITSLFKNKKDSNYIWTTDEDIYQDAQEDEMELGVDIHGRLLKPDNRLRRALDDKYLLSETSSAHFNYQIPESLHETINKTVTFSPGKSLWSSYFEKERILDKFKEVEEYFYVPLPESIKSDPSSLVKKKYEESPEIRFVSREEFDYTKLPPKHKDQPITPHEKVKQEISEFLRKLTNVKDTDIHTPGEKYLSDMRFGEEESKLYEVVGSYRFHTDTEEEEKAIREINTEDRYLEIERDPLKYMRELAEENDEKEIVDQIMNYPEKSFTAKYLYKGADLETHIEQLRKERPELKIDWDQSETGEKFVHLTLPSLMKYKYEEIKYFIDKYGDSLKRYEDEIEIDKEDEELFHELNNIELDVPRFIYEMSLQKQALENRKYEERLFNPATIRRVGPDFQGSTYIEEFEEPGKYTFEELEKVINERS